MSPLRGRTAIFLVEGRRENLDFARGVVSVLCRGGTRCTVMDVDALYSSNSDYVFASLSAEEADSVEMLVPEPDSELESGFARLLGSHPGSTLIIDSLNSLYHLMSTGRTGSRNRNVGFIMAFLSFMARTDGRAVLLTMYRRERGVRLVPGKSISDLSDLTASVRVGEGVLGLKCERGSAWPGGEFSVPLT